MSFERLASVDIAVLVAYAVGMIAIGALCARQAHGAQDYFLAGRSMGWPVIGFSLFASNISSTTLVGLAGAAYATGISVYNYEWSAGIILIFMAVVILPFLLRAQVYTMPEYLERRYDRTARLYFAGLTLFLNIVVDMAASLYAGALLVQLVLPEVEVWRIVAGLALAAGAYTVLGGLKAVMITDVIQAALLILGSIAITVAAAAKLGGPGDWLAAAPPNALSLIRPIDDPSLPWLGLVLGVPILGFYFWCANQFMVQRLLSARSLDHARWGALFAGLLKVPVLFIMVLPGIMALGLYPDLPDADQVYPTLVFDLLPAGVLGLVLAGFIAALMSQIDSTLNSASTLVTMDFVRSRRPELSQTALLRIGRVVAALVMGLAVLWAPQIARFEGLFVYLQQVLAYTVPPIVALLLVGAFWPRANARGALWALIGGTSAGAAAFALIVLAEAVSLHFLYVAPLLAVISALALVAGSLTAPPPPPEKVAACLWTRAGFAAEGAALRGQPVWRNYRWQAIGLIGLTAAVVIAFW
ncbi:MAG: sodium:solute symporter [Maricaulaceae bacterium]